VVYGLCTQRNPFNLSELCYNTCTHILQRVAERTVKGCDAQDPMRMARLWSDYRKVGGCLQTGLRLLSAILAVVVFLGYAQWPRS
jgi:hypothetical protein